MRVANSSGWSATDSGTVLPPVTPARMRWNMSAAYRREQDGHSDARRFPHRTCTTPSGWSALEKLDSTSPVAASIRSEVPRRRTGRTQLPTRASVVAPGAEVLRHQSGDDQSRHLRRQVVELQDAPVGSVVVLMPGVVVVGRRAGVQC